MATWNEVRIAAPELAARIEARMEEYKHKALATLRKDGSPRITGIEAQFVLGDVWMGMMPGSLKARDLQRDGRMALHSATIYEGTASLHDAKLAGRAVEITDDATLRRYLEANDQLDSDSPSGSFHLFRIDVTEIAFMSLGGDPPDHMVIESWREGETGTRVVKQY